VLLQPDAAAGGGIIGALARAAEPWRDVYSNATPVATAIVFAHLAALVVGGGLAIASDRATVRAARVLVGAADARARQLGELAAAHRTVIASLGVAAATGALLFLADVEEYAHSVTFWIKMGLVALLLANGWAMTRAERGLAVGGEGARTDGLWGRLRFHAGVSLVLWLATLLAGVALSNA
jgi:hypothetical protein